MYGVSGITRLSSTLSAIVNFFHRKSTSDHFSPAFLHALRR